MEHIGFRVGQGKREDVTGILFPFSLLRTGKFGRWRLRFVIPL